MRRGGLFGGAMQGEGALEKSSWRAGRDEAGVRFEGKKRKSAALLRKAP
jgi:hypothetical protein